MVIEGTHFNSMGTGFNSVFDWVEYAVTFDDTIMIITLS